MFIIIKTIIIFFVLIKNIIATDNIALPCLGCHNKTNTSINKSIPNIHGLDKAYLEQALIEYKENIRKNYIMRIIAKGYSKDQIIFLSEYFSRKHYENK